VQSKFGDWVSSWMGQAKDNPLGLVALGIALIAGLSFQFLRREDWRVRLAWLVALLIALAALAWLVVAPKKPELPPTETNFNNLDDDALLEENASKFKPYARTVVTSSGTGIMSVEKAETDKLSLTISAKLAYEPSGCERYPAMCGTVDKDQSLALPTGYIQQWLCAPYTDSRARLDRGIPVAIEFEVSQDGRTHQESYQVECNK
jgi:hypothetical protein